MHKVAKRSIFYPRRRGTILRLAYDEQEARHCSIETCYYIVTIASKAAKNKSRPFLSKASCVVIYNRLPASLVNIDDGVSCFTHCFSFIPHRYLYYTRGLELRMQL